MKPTFMNIPGVLLGWIIGSLVALAIVKLGHEIFPLAGVDYQNVMELSLAFETAPECYFIFPLVGHSLGTLIGTTIGGTIGFHRQRVVLIIASIFFLSALIINILVATPYWFKITDLIIAFFPMSWIGYLVSLKFVRYRKFRLA